MIKIENVLYCNKVIAVLKEDVSMFDAHCVLTYNLYFNEKFILSFKKVVDSSNINVLFAELLHNDFTDLAVDNVDMKNENEIFLTKHLDINKILIVQNEFGYDISLRKDNQRLLDTLISDIEEIKIMINGMLV